MATVLDAASVCPPVAGDAWVIELDMDPPSAWLLGSGGSGGVASPHPTIKTKRPSSLNMSKFCLDFGQRAKRLANCRSQQQPCQA